MADANPPSGTSGNGVTWRELHAELRQRDREQRERDDEQRNLLEEIRDSLGSMHTSIVSLPCEQHTAQTQALSQQLADMKGHVIDIRALRKIVPTKSPRILLVAMGITASVLGWDWWPRLRALIDQASK